jgi:hypothetical protein
VHTFRPGIFALALAIAFPAAATEGYSIGELIEALRRVDAEYERGGSGPSKESEGFEQEDARAVFFLSGTWRTYVVMAEYDRHQPEDAVSPNMQVSRTKLPGNLADLTKGLLLSYAAYEHLREQSAADFLQAYLLGGYGATAEAWLRARDVRDSMVMRAGFRYREAPESVPAFGNWFERCKATASKGGLSALSQMDRDHYELALEMIERAGGRKAPSSRSPKGK